MSPILFSVSTVALLAQRQAKTPSTPAETPDRRYTVAYAVMGAGLLLVIVAGLAVAVL